MVSRILNWDVAAVTWAQAQLGRPFVWGVTDCASLTRQMLAAIYGHDIVPPAIAYTSLLDALRWDRALGGVPGVLEALGAWSLESPLEATTGDVLVAPSDASSEAGRHPFPLALPVLGLHLLVASPDAAVAAAPLIRPPIGAVAYRLPFVLPMDVASALELPPASAAPRLLHG